MFEILNPPEELDCARAEVSQAAIIRRGINKSERIINGMTALRFECQPACTRCCEQQGFVYLTEDDLTRIARFLGLDAREFERRYVYRTRNLRRLRVPRHQQCSFLREGGCSIHEVKPVQCRLFPFWPELVDGKESKREWKKTAQWCPGIGKGELVQIEAARERASEMKRAYPSMY